ncbi:MAG: hypothetical protein QM528_05630 [Phycisphaerales bacterium]|nr:hypothetical protein [Phycisphaerales bacterium]
MNIFTQFRYLLFLFLLINFFFTSFSQEPTKDASQSSGGDNTKTGNKLKLKPVYKYWEDTAKNSKTGQLQYQAFKKNNYPYPPKPRDKWEISAHLGLPIIHGPILPALGIGGGIAFRKSLGHVFSVRFEYTGSLSRGYDNQLQYLSSDGTTKAGYGLWNRYTDLGLGFVPNYRTTIHQVDVNFLATLNNISYYRSNPKWNIYLLAGVSLMAVNFTIDAFDRNNNLYDFSSINFDGSNSNIRKQVRNLLEGSRNPQGQPSGVSVLANLGATQTLRIGANTGIGASFKITKHVNIGIEEKLTLPVTGNLDGYTNSNNLSNYNFLSYTNIRVNINLGNKNRKVEPLYWINPNDYLYATVNTPKTLKTPKVVLPDADNDGVTDQFDLQPNTPPGARVDTHGVTMDVDTDGVPDYRDKEPLTQLNCFPVNADGVGSCPEPSCCKEVRDLTIRMEDIEKEVNATANNSNNNVIPDSSMGVLPSIHFKTGYVDISPENENVLRIIADKMRKYPSANVQVSGYTGIGYANKMAQQMSWDKVNNTIKYLVDKLGIDEHRLIFSYGANGDANTVNFLETKASSPNRIPPPVQQGK